MILLTEIIAAYIKFMFQTFFQMRIFFTFVFTY